VSRVAFALLFVSCATPYALHFDRVERTVDPDVEVEATLDPANAREIVLTVHNLTAQPLQVAWGKIVLVDSDDAKTALKPESDLGWVLPSSTLTAQLSPFILPTAGDEAKALEARRFVLQIPMTVNDEARVVHCTFVAHAQPL
jgi:hypothetical protein